MGKTEQDYTFLKSRVANSMVNRSVTVGNLNALIAEELERVFNEFYYESNLIEKFPHWTHSGSSPFKRCIAKLLEAGDFVSESEHEINKLKTLKGKIMSIVTTNYDTLIESIFELDKDSTFIGQHQLFNDKSVGVNEIYKIHGCVTEPERIIITKGDYEQYRENAKLFSAKLLTLISENPVIFLGYSIEDPNVQQTLVDLVGCLTEDQLAGLQNHFYMVKYKPGEQELIEQTYLFPATSYEGHQVSFPVTIIETDNYFSFYERLSNLTPAMNINAVKQVKRLLKEIVIESTDVVESSDPVITIMADDLNQLDRMSKEQKMAIAIGPFATISEIGYGVKPKVEIFEDVLKDNKNLDAKRLLKETYENHYLKITQNIPIYKYVDLAGEETLGLCPKVQSYIKNKNTVEGYLNSSIVREIRNIPEGNSMADIPSHYATSFRRKYLWIFRNITNISISELKEFLISQLPEYENLDSNKKSDFNRLVAIYDLLRYKK